MTAPKSIKIKPKKPRPDWPLTASSNGQWVKKIKGKVYSFGRWDEPQEALKRYLNEKDHIHAYGCRPIDDGGIKLDVAVHQFLTRQRDRRDGLIGKPVSDRHFEDLRSTCGLILKTFSKSRSVICLHPRDFAVLYRELATTGEGKLAAASTVKRKIALVKAFFNWLHKNALIPARVNFGSDFVPPIQSGAVDEFERAKGFSPVEVWQMLNAAPWNTKAAIWLGLNCGLSNSCFSNITLKAIDLEAKTVTWKRWKVRNNPYAKVREIPLWPETVNACREALLKRPVAKDPANVDLFFLTRYGNQFDGQALPREIGKLKNVLNIDRVGTGFHSFRHVIQSNGGTDTAAIEWILGRIPQGTEKHYRVSMPIDRINHVLKHVRAWLETGAIK